MSNHRIEEFAKTRDWIAFSKALCAALDDPAHYGFDDGSQLLAQVAKLRGIEPSSLRNPLAAANWIKRHVPEVLERVGLTPPMTGVLTLSQITDISQDLGAELTPKFFAGEITCRQLEIALERAEAAHKRQGDTARDRVKRTKAFEDQVFELFQESPELLELGSKVKVVRSQKDALVPSDFTVFRDGKVVAAVECKPYRSKRHRRYLIETLAMAALIAKREHHAILVVPKTWGESIEQLSALRHQLCLADVRIGVFELKDEMKKKFEFSQSNE